MNILDRIVEAKRREVAATRAAVPLEQMAAAACQAQPPRDFYGALSLPAPHGFHLIAEVKRASPSAGVIRPDFDPAALARLYHQAGASAVSVLTDTPYFQGSLEHLTQVKQAVPLPVLRKDFIIDDYQIHEARCHGADAVLLIAEVLGTDTIHRLADLAADLGMTSLIEVHSSECLDAVLRALDFFPAARRLPAINNRDLTTQQTDVTHTERLSARVPRDLPFVSESGIKTRGDVEQVVGAGARAVLVGESLLRAADPADKIHELFGIIA